MEVSTSTRPPVLSQATSPADVTHAIPDAASATKPTPDASDPIDLSNPLSWLRLKKGRRRYRVPLVPKSLNMKFVPGEYSLRQLLPSHNLPPCLDPEFVNCNSVKELPLCWYGVPLITDNVLRLAIELDLAVHLEFNDEEYDWLLSFYKLRDYFEEETGGICYRLVNGWGTIMDELPLIGFFSNRDMLDMTEEDMGYIYGLLDMMEYPKGFMKRNLRWYPDINETR